MTVLFDDPRTAWGALPPTNPVKLDIAKVTRFVNHWDATGLAATRSHVDCLSMVQAIQRYHQTDPDHEWSDIGYTGLVCPHGRTIEGRGLEYVGAHTAGFNSTAWGWCFLAGPSNPVTDLAYDRMHDVALACEDVAGRTLVRSSHRDHAQTDCPGDEAYAWVQGGMLSPLGDVADAMTREQADALIKAVGGLADEVRILQAQHATLSDADARILSELADSTAAIVAAITEDTQNVLDQIAPLADQIALRVSTVVSTAIVESITASLGGFETTTRYLRREP